MDDNTRRALEQWRDFVSQDQNTMDNYPMVVRRELPPCQGSVGEYIDIPVYLVDLYHPELMDVRLTDGTFKINTKFEFAS